MTLPSFLFLLLLVHWPHLKTCDAFKRMAKQQTFQSLIVSSAAALATVLPSGEVANRRTLSEDDIALQEISQIHSIPSSSLDLDCQG